jgi:hypothetical protein
MAKQSKAINAGVHNSIGIEFQKHFALYFLVENYSSFKGKNYFICIEHHDDVLFCFQTEEELVSKVQAFQAKKANTQWGMSNELYEIIDKVIQTGRNLNEDKIPKVTDYSHDLTFVTNHSIGLHCGGRKPNKKSLTINEANATVKYVDLDTAIQAKIETELLKITDDSAATIDQLKNFSLGFIDLPKTATKQLQTIVGSFASVFGNRVQDCDAAVRSLISLFRDVENTLNQGNVVQLMDNSKRVNSTVIEQAINIITTRSKAYDIWRNKSDTISDKISIGVLERNNFEMHFLNSIDLFKDLKQVEHRKVLKFVEDTVIKWQHHTNEVDCIESIFIDFKNNNQTTLNDLQLKAAIFAAYVEKTA